MEGNKRVDELMLPVLNAINRHVKDRDAKTDIYNRAYEALLISMDVKDMEISNLSSENAALRERVRWIPVSEKLPKDNQEVLIYADLIAKGVHSTKSRQWSADGYYYHGDWYDTVTHWMPLPQPQEAE